MAKTQPQPRQPIPGELLARAKIERDRRLELRGLHADGVARYLRRGEPLKTQIEALLETLDDLGEGSGVLAHHLRERLHDAMRDLARAEVWGTPDAGNTGEIIAGAALRAQGSNAMLVRARDGEGSVETLWRVLIEWGCSAEQIGALAERDGQPNHDGAARKRAARWIAKFRAELVAARQPHEPYASLVDEMLARLGSGTSEPQSDS